MKPQSLETLISQILWIQARNHRAYLSHRKKRLQELIAGLFIANSEHTDKNTQEIAFFSSIAKNLSGRITGQYSKSKTDTELKTDLQICRNHIDKYWHIGARKSEVLRWTWAGDINFEERWVRSGTRKNRTSEITYEKLWINDDLYKLLKWQWDHRHPTSPFVFCYMNPKSKYYGMRVK